MKNFSELRKSDVIRIMTQPEERKYWIKYEVEHIVKAGNVVPNGI